VPLLYKEEYGGDLKNMAEMNQIQTSVHTPSWITCLSAILPFAADGCMRQNRKQKKVFGISGTGITGSLQSEMQECGLPRPVPLQLSDRKKAPWKKYGGELCYSRKVH